MNSVTSLESNDVKRQAFEIIRNRRRDLVKAAEEVIDNRFQQKNPLRKPKKTQFQNLVGLCNEAACAEEITNYLRYQAGRGEWESEFTKEVINAIDRVLKLVSEDIKKLPAELSINESTLQIDAWKLFATYLTRAFVYQDKVAATTRRF